MPAGAIGDFSESLRARYGDLRVHHYHIIPNEPNTLGRLLRGTVLDATRCMSMYPDRCAAAPATVQQLVSDYGDDFDIDCRLYCPCFRHANLSHSFRRPTTSSYVLRNARAQPAAAVPADVAATAANVVPVADLVSNDARSVE
eukprot:gene8267-9822_t